MLDRDQRADGARAHQRGATFHEGIFEQRVADAYLPPTRAAGVSNGITVPCTRRQRLFHVHVTPTLERVNRQRRMRRWRRQYVNDIQTEIREGVERGHGMRNVVTGSGRRCPLVIWIGDPHHVNEWEPAERPNVELTDLSRPNEPDPKLMRVQVSYFR
jgi:hypothetical protein